MVVFYGALLITLVVVSAEAFRGKHTVYQKMFLDESSLRLKYSVETDAITACSLSEFQTSITDKTLSSKGFR